MLQKHLKTFFKKDLYLLLSTDLNVMETDIEADVKKSYFYNFVALTKVSF